MSDDKTRSGGDSWTHPPLPYIVRVRETIGGDDTVPMEHEVQLRAYTLFEALLQATIAVGGSSVDDSRYKVIGIEPDLNAYALDQYLALQRSR